EGHATRYGYDGLNRLTSIIPPTGNATTITYSHPSGSGNSIRFGGIIKTAQRGPLTQTTTEFDGFGHPLNIRLDDVYHFYHYDALGRRTMVSNPGPIPDPNSTVPYSNYVTRYDYDSLDRVVQVTHQDGAQRTLSHGTGARTVTDERGNATTYRYRAYGDPGQQFLMEIDAPEPAANVTLTRNGVDLVTTVTQDGFTRTYGYNDHYYLTAVDHPETGTTAYDRDEAGNMLSRKVGLEERTDYTYDAQNRLDRVYYPGNTPAVTHTYSKTGKLKSVSSSVATRGFDYFYFVRFIYLIIINK
ncbi:MAG: hypothetical protein P9F19_02665, partial [Candidatus Contendobacter sp.]|nr:hypothetical protein [Candidatus Contendobacter sp.]